MERDTLKYRVLSILTNHIGREKAIDMGELYERSFGASYRHKINGTTPLRRIITELRREGRQICSSRSHVGGGYYLARSGHESISAQNRILAEGIRKFEMVARMRKIGLPELLGQMSLALRDGQGGSQEGGKSGIPPAAGPQAGH